MAGERPGGAETGGSHGGWDCVAEASQVYEAELIALRLRGEGLEAQVVDQSYRQEPLPMVRSFSVVRVLVPLAQAGAARKVLERPVAIPEDAVDELTEVEQD